MDKEIKLRILLKDPVDGISYGLQKGKGAKYGTVQAQLGQGLDLTFDFAVHTKHTDGSALSFLGPFVQGIPGNRFVYITIGSYAGQAEAPWSGRLKVPLPHTTFQDTIPNDDEYCWFCTVPGTTEEGKPVFATVKPFEGWSMTKLSG